MIQQQKTHSNLEDCPSDPVINESMLNIFEPRPQDSRLYSHSCHSKHSSLSSESFYQSGLESSQDEATNKGGGPLCELGFQSPRYSAVLDKRTSSKKVPGENHPGPLTSRSEEYDPDDDVELTLGWLTSEEVQEFFGYQVWLRHKKLIKVVE